MSVLNFTSQPKSIKVFFGGHFLPEAAGETHFMIVGTTGSGKTLTFKMMMKSIIPDFFSGELKRNVVIFDEKRDIYSFLRHELNIDAQNIQITNPFDSRCCAWDISKDIKGPDTALQISTILIPEDAKSSNRYFSDAARVILTGVIRTLIVNTSETGESWYFSDVLSIMRNVKHIRHILSTTNEGQEILDLHLQEGKTANDILSTVGAYLAPFEVIGALWKKAQEEEPKRLFSLNQFLKQKSILILGSYQEARAPIEAINRLLFQRLTQLILAQDENPHDGEHNKRRTWFFLDELRKLGNLPGLDDLMNNGRSKGACVVIGFQDIQGLRHVYGQHLADEITSMCSTVAVLRLAGSVTPKWAAENFGEERTIRITENFGLSTGSRASTNYNSTMNQSIYDKNIYYDSLFKSLSIVNRPNYPLDGYYFSPYIFLRGRGRHHFKNGADIYQPDDVDINNDEPLPQPFRYTLAWEQIDLILPRRNHNEQRESDFLPYLTRNGEIDESVKYLNTLNNKDWKKLGLKIIGTKKEHNTLVKNEQNNPNGFIPLQRKGVKLVTKANGDKVEIM